MATVEQLLAEYRAKEAELQREWNLAARERDYTKAPWRDRANALSSEYARRLAALGYHGPLGEPPAAEVERCLFCGTAVTPGQLIGNTLANGAMPKMAELGVKAMRLHTDEVDRLRKLADILREARGRFSARGGPGDAIADTARRFLDEAGLGAPILETAPTPADLAFYLHRLDMCRCGKRRGDHEGAEPQPCPETGCGAFALAGAHDPRASPLESPGWAEFRRVKHLADAAAKAIDALESVGEQARQRIIELTAALREACDAAETVGPHHDKLARLRQLADRAARETPA